MAKKKATVEDHVKRYVKCGEVIKELYEEQQARMTAIIDAKLRPGQLITVSTWNKVYEYKDNFADTNIIFRSCAAKRFDIVEVKAKKGKK